MVAIHNTDTTQVLTDIYWLTFTSFWFFHTVVMQCLNAPHDFATRRSLHQYDSPQAHLSTSTAEPTAKSKHVCSADWRKSSATTIMCHIHRVHAFNAYSPCTCMVNTTLQLNCCWFLCTSNAPKSFVAVASSRWAPHPSVGWQGDEQYEMLF